ncbi:TPA: EpsG family protein, partial [Klebsiella quasipneumoniae subsp. similipneumoniae]|nr:EpsG family protein [Klebsiella quasipneumoniae subsp. similipneumoniae]
PMYFVCHVNVKLEIKLLSAFLISLIGSSFIINILAESNDRYSNYTSAMTKNGSGLYTVAFYVIIASFIYLFGGQERKVNKDYNCFEQLLLCGVMALIPIAAL